jgi:hypothetical protein
MIHASDRMVGLTDLADSWISVKILICGLCHGRPPAEQSQVRADDCANGVIGCPNCGRYSTLVWKIINAFSDACKSGFGCLSPCIRGRAMGIR